MSRRVPLREQSDRSRTHYTGSDRHTHLAETVTLILSTPPLRSKPHFYWAQEGDALSPLPEQPSQELSSLFALSVSLSVCPAEPESHHRRRTSQHSHTVCADYALSPHHRPAVYQRHRLSADWSVADNAQALSILSRCRDVRSIHVCRSPLVG